MTFSPTELKFSSGIGVTFKHFKYCSGTQHGTRNTLHSVEGGGHPFPKVCAIMTLRKLGDSDWLNGQWSVDLAKWAIGVLGQPLNPENNEYFSLQA